MRYRVQVKSGRTVLHTARRSTYAAARELARQFVHYPATIRPEFTEGEARALVVLVCAVILFAFNYATKGA
jgi:hypothetical protein